MGALGTSFSSSNVEVTDGSATPTIASIRQRILYEKKVSHHSWEITTRGSCERLLTFVVFVSEIILDELKRIVKEADLFDKDDRKWPRPDRIGR